MGIYLNTEKEYQYVGQLKLEFLLIGRKQLRNGWYNRSYFF